MFSRFKANKTHCITNNKKMGLIPILDNDFSVVVMSMLPNLLIRRRFIMYSITEK